MKKPSKIKSIKAKVMPSLMGKRFAAITLCGTIYTKKQSAADVINSTESLDSVLETHEMIHVKQAVSTKNTWFLFYIHYIFEWLFNLPLAFVNGYAPYKFMPLELEAYRYEYNTEHALQEKCETWRKYRKLGIKTRYRLARLWYKNKVDYNYSFLKFISSEIDSLVK